MRSICLFIVVCCAVGAHAQDINILDYGAKGDGITLNTEAIQVAIDEASSAGGGKVIIPPGRFVSGTIFLKSGVELHLSREASLVGSIDPVHYKKRSYWTGFVMAEGQRDITISGEGQIDGRGRRVAMHLDSLFYAGDLDSSRYNLVDKRPIYNIRPQLVVFLSCENISLSGVTLRNSASWVQTYDKCHGLFIDGVTVDSDAYWNNDGIDISDCRNVKITNCTINASDDGICLKSHSKQHFCDSVYIGNCIVRSSASAVKFGTRSYGGFRNVRIENIRVYDTFRSAIAIECVDGGILEDVLVDSVHAVNTGNAIFIRLGKRKKDRPASVLRNVEIRNLYAEIAFERPDYAYEIRGPALPFFHNTFPSSITGIPGSSVENVVLENIDIRYPGRGNKGLAYAPLSRLEDIPEKVEDYPEFSMFGELPAWGLYIRHVDGLIMNNVRLSIDAPDYRPAIVMDDAVGVQLGNMTFRGDEKEYNILTEGSSVDVDSDGDMIIIKGQ